MKNRISHIMKDERGLSLVELLAVVVIMAIVAGIGAVAISTVIQKAREDAGVSNVQQMINAANMYQMGATAEEAITPEDKVTIDTIQKAGFMSNIAFIKNGNEDKTFFIVDNDNNGMVSIKLPEAALMAGSKPNKEGTFSEEEVSVLTREQLFDGKGQTPPQ